jgi:enoyl-[acyl-carrier-protein] reductase (NADH)
VLNLEPDFLAVPDVRHDTLTNVPTTPADQAEAYFPLVSQLLSKTTGQIITVDGGLHEAYLR